MPLSLPAAIAHTGPRIGTAGWSYPQWDGIVYPKPQTRGLHALEYLARFVDLVEINSSFYRPLQPEVTKVWMKKVEANQNFCFTAKLHQRFTHRRKSATFRGQGHSRKVYGHFTVRASESWARC